MVISPDFFYILKIMIFWVAKGVKEQKIAQNEHKNYIRHAPYLRNSMAYDRG